MPLDANLEIYIRNYFDDATYVLGGFMTTFTPTEQIFQITTPGPTIALTSVPAPNTLIQVFKNGLLLVNQNSYTVDTSGVIFTFNQALSAGDVVVVFYWV